MHRLTSLPLLVPVAVLSLGLLLAEGWWLQRVRGEAERALQDVQKLRQERSWLVHREPALSAENEAALAAEVEAGGRVIGDFKRTLAGPGPEGEVASPPAGSTEAYFALIESVGNLRNRARQAQVQVKADEGFGFASHANAGPPAGLVAVVHRQLLATEYLVGKLLESRPVALLAVRRERPAGEGANENLSKAEDFFVLDSRLSVRRPGEVEGEAFQLEFTGPTSVLRLFLNQLAAGPQPVVVRGVEVEPLTTAATPTVPAVVTKAWVVTPLIEPVVSRFTVSLEILRLAENAGTPAP